MNSLSNRVTTSTKVWTMATLALALGTANCHQGVKATSPEVKCTLDRDCGTGSLCHPTQKVCLMTYPDQRLLAASYDIKSCSLSNIYFAFDSADLTPEGKQWLDYDVRCIKAHAQPVVLDGYSDAKGEPGYNVDLSNRRAMAVKQYLDQNGVSTAQLAGKGDQNPVTTGTTEQDYAWNRRVELRFQ